jgi:hypothetical protein
MSKGRVDGSTPRQPVDVNPPAGPAPRRSGDAAPPVIDEAKARFVTGANAVEGAFPVAAGARGGRLTEGQALAMNVVLRAAAMLFPRFEDPNSGGSDPNSGVG